MNFHCDGCDRISAHVDLKRCVITSEVNSRFLRFCRYCCDSKASVPDVFWDGRPEINLADGPDGNPLTFSSKHEKARYLKANGIMEAGDKVRGSFPTVTNNPQRVDMRDAARKALAQVKQMGKDVRRQEFLRITKEAQQTRGR